MTATLHITSDSTTAPMRPGGARVEGARAVSYATASAATASATAAPVTKMRLTRRGRIVFGTLATVLVAALFAVLASFAAPGAIASEEQGAENFPYTVVAQGETLWSIAQDLDTKADTRDVVDEIMSLNQMQSADLRAGDSIAVPQRFASKDRTFPWSEL